MSKNVPRFLDLDLDDQHQRFLLQAWMYSEPEASISEPTEVRGSYRSALEYDPNALTVVYSAGTQTEFEIPNLANDICSGWCQFYSFCGEAMATAAPVPVYSDPEEPTSLIVEVEPEAASIEDGVVAFRTIPARVREAVHSGGVRLSADATQFLARARGRRIHFEDDPERQSE